jgi:hypothetical protein
MGYATNVFLFGAAALISLTNNAAYCQQSDHPQHIALSKDTVIDTDKFSTRDPTKPFAFYLHQTDPVSKKSIAKEFTVEVGTVFDVWLDDKVPPGTDLPGAKSLAIKISSDQNINVKDKVLFDAVSQHVDEEKMDVEATNTTRYFSFDFMLDPTYETPNGWLLHVQAWQCCYRHPPFAIHVTPNPDKTSPIELTFIVDDDKLDTPTYEGKTIYKMSIPRASWNSMVLRLEPRPDNSPNPGSVAMWLNGEKKFVYSGFWGYIPTSKVRGDNVITSEMGIHVGMYRRRQTTKQIIYLDNIKYGRTLSSVAPTLSER